ncbi:MAG: molecular chaperone TorD family protein [Armatimonadota bacterium]|nr:molecular chaperone TorD family protein [Armatimonadota bacterium]MDR7452572.1 molecular chaperone TorD family protein [Armatimonadota bacterium]MDR7468213.1 molecular chaperone TorD family protein [Armatimonadota bacterium]MDR7495073.1 molecular chaperone TorD family protein [Armatimonadota bacterium]MDR7500107.1 molecular chaperone TorD family protein [Armatimonadota bacterium]
MPEQTLARLARFRAGAYRLLSQVFLYPEPRRVRSLQTMASGLLRQRALLSGLAVGLPWWAFLDTLRRLPHHQGEGLQTEYVRLFGLDGAGGPAPTESAFLVEDPRLAAAVVLAVEREYAAQGLAAAGPSGEPPDHAAVELEFMSALCGLEAAAWLQVSSEAGVSILSRERQFLSRHLGRWFPSLARAVGAAAQSGFYAQATAAADGFVHHDQDLIDLLSRLIAVGSGGEAARARDR